MPVGKCRRRPGVPPLSFFSLALCVGAARRAAAGGDAAQGARAMLHLIEQDLRALSEVRDARKFPEVKEAAERALLRLRSIAKATSPSAPAAEQAQQVAASEEILVPFMLALASKSEGLPLAALGSVQRMISHNAVAPQRLPTITSQLIARAQLPSADEPSLLKVLQTVLTIASSPALLQSDTIVAQLLLLCLTLQQSRAPTVKGTASAIVQQFVALLLDHVAAEGLPAAPAKEGALAAPTEEALKSLSVATRCSYLAIRDLCLLANGEPALWLPGSGPVGVPFALEVIQRTLQSHKALFTSLTPFRYLLRERVSSLVLKTMQAPMQEWPAALRLAHLTSTLLSGYAAVLRTECEILLSMLVKTAAAEASPLWHRALALEACRVVSADPPGLYALFAAYDMAAKSAPPPSLTSSLRAEPAGVFATFVASLCGLLKSPTVNFAQHAEYIEAHFLRQHRQMPSVERTATFNIGLYSEGDGTHLTNDYAASLAVECQVLMARAIGYLGETLRARDDAAAADDAAGGPAAKPSALESKVAPYEPMDPAVMREMVGVCWQPLLSALSVLMARFSSEEAIQLILKCYQAFTQACAALELTAPKEAFLASLCHSSLPQDRASRAGDTTSFSSIQAMIDTAYEPLPQTRLSAKNVQVRSPLIACECV